FVGQVDIRQLYCPTCGVKMHRDVMAGHNMCNIIQGHLLHHKRPHYLQPYDKNGVYIWEMEGNESMLTPLAVKDVEVGIDQMAPEAEETGPGRRKRAAPKGIMLFLRLMHASCRSRGIIAGTYGSQAGGGSRQAATASQGQVYDSRHEIYGIC
ncbi:hypothetical protein BGX30_004078, partial [Mortierella sp. GBA39]